jgi:hypothetical protein
VGIGLLSGVLDALVARTCRKRLSERAGISSCILGDPRVSFIRIASLCDPKTQTQFVHIVGLNPRDLLLPRAVGILPYSASISLPE